MANKKTDGEQPARPRLCQACKGRGSKRDPKTGKGRRCAECGGTGVDRKSVPAAAPVEKGEQ